MVYCTCVSKGTGALLAALHRRAPARGERDEKGEQKNDTAETIPTPGGRAGDLRWRPAARASIDRFSPAVLETPRIRVTPGVLPGTYRWRYTLIPTGTRAPRSWKIRPITWPTFPRVWPVVALPPARARAGSSGSGDSRVSRSDHLVIGSFWVAHASPSSFDTTIPPWRATRHK